MQLTPRYLVDNKITIIANDAGLITEYRPVYQRHIKVYKGISIERKLGTKFVKRSHKCRKNVCCCHTSISPLLLYTNLPKTPILLA